jgi:hypothetical protein
MRVCRMKTFRRFQRKEDIGDDELREEIRRAADLFRASQDDLERMVRDNRLTELNYDEED